jgi:hypothetical protein
MSCAILVYSTTLQIFNMGCNNYLCLHHQMIIKRFTLHKSEIAPIDQQNTGFSDLLKIYIKKLILNKKCCKEKLVLERRLVCKKKEKNCVKRGCRCKNVDAYETSAHYRRILVTPLRTNAGDIFDVYLSNHRNTYKFKDNIRT